MKKILVTITMVFLSFMIVNAEEENLLEEVELTSQEVDVIDNFNYDISDELKVEKKVNGSGLYIGQDISVDDNIDGLGFFVSAENMKLNGNTEYGIIIANSLTVNNTVEKDLFVAALSSNIGKDAIISRDLFIFSGELVIEGEIKRDAYLGGDNITIKKGSIINGDVRIAANTITIEEDVIIEGTLKYNDGAQINIENKENFIVETYEGNFNATEEDQTSNNIYSFIYKTIGFMIMFLLINWLFPKIFSNLKGLYDKPINYLKNIGIGFGILIILPIISLVLLVPSYTLYIGLFLLLFYFMIMYLSFVFAGHLLGSFISKFITLKKERPILFSLLGIVILMILTLLPLVNILVITLGYGSVFWLIAKVNKE